MGLGALYLFLLVIVVPIVAIITGEFLLSLILGAIFIGFIIFAANALNNKEEEKEKEEMLKEREQIEKFEKEHEEEYEQYSTKYDKTLEEYQKSENYFDSEIRHYCIIDNKLRILPFKETLYGAFKYGNGIVPTELNEEIYDLDKVKYYSIEGSISERQYISGGGGGGSSVSGAIVGGLIAGEAGAIIGSRKQTEAIKTTYLKTDDRKLVITFKDGTTLKLIIDIYELLLESIPEKEYSNYIENKKAKGRISV